ncbi:MAG: nucleotidyltransferase domain-containing protein [Oscillospiraceae bacterium]|jgi:predicted nucleotidyltransferase|nr:nucleotidyltransferase domain-containing protein [Oscillospiraceae bacterium]
MVADIETINDKARAYAAQVRQVLPVQKAYLFGSYAKGTATRQSDVDVCFFLDNFGGKRRVEIIKELLKLTEGYGDVGFEPLALPASELRNGNPFALEITNTGIEI